MNGIGQSDGGSILFSTPPAPGVIVTLRRRLVIERTSDFQESGQFRAKIINDELDYLTAAIQQLEAETERSIRLEPSDTEATLTLPSAAARAGKAIVFDENGNVATKPVDLITTQPTTVSLDAISEGAMNKHFTQLEKTKLAAIEEGAQANPPKITTDEKSTAEGTEVRAFSPSDLKDMLTVHGRTGRSVSSVYGRTGDVAAKAGDYTAAQIADTAEKVVMTAAERAKLAGVEAGAQVNSVTSVHGRTGEITAQAGDYTAAQVADTAEKVVMTAAERAKLAGVEAGAQVNSVTSVHGRRGEITAQAGDYTAAQVADTAEKVIMTAAERAKLAGVEARAQLNSVTSVHGRTGEITAQAGDYTAAQIADTAEKVVMTAAERETLTRLAAAPAPGDIAHDQIGKIDSGRLLGRAAAGQGNAQQLVVSHGLQLTTDGELQLSGAAGGTTAQGFYGRDTAGAYGFKDIVPSDLKGIGAARLLGNPTTSPAAAGEIPIGMGSANSIPTVGDADGRYLRKSFADSTTTVASVAADDVIVLNDTSAAGAAVRAPISALPFVQAGQRGLANGVGSLDDNGRQPITEAANGAAEETAFVVTCASYTLGRRCIIVRDGCNEIQLASASGAYKNVYISNEKTSGSVTIRAVPGQTINGQPTYNLAAGNSIALIVIGDAGQTAWRAESGNTAAATAVVSAGQPTIIANRGANAYQLTASGNNRHVCFRYSFWTTQRSAVNGLRLALPGWFQALFDIPAASLTLSAQTVGSGRTATPGASSTGARVFTARDVGNTITLTSGGAGSATITAVNSSTGVATIDITAEFTGGMSIAAWGWRINVLPSSLDVNVTEHDNPVNIFPRASIEYGGQVARVYWSGARSRALEPGATLVSDPVGLRIPANTQFWVRMDPATLNSGEKYLSGGTGVAAFGEGFVTANAEARLDDADSFTPSGQTTQPAILAVMGVTSESDPPSVVMIGSSSTWGQGETLPVTDGIGDAGYIARFISNRCGYSKMALSGDRLAYWKQPDGATRRLAALVALRPKFVIWQLGAGDISAGVSAATVQSDLINAWNQVTSLGIKVIATTFTPVTTSTDSWATLANQTTVANTTRQSINAWIKSIPSPLSGIIDFAVHVEDATGGSPTGKWKVDGTPNKYTADGTHCSTFGHITAAAGAAGDGVSLALLGLR